MQKPSESSAPSSEPSAEQQSTGHEPSQLDSSAIAVNAPADAAFHRQQALTIPDAPVALSSIPPQAGAPVSSEERTAASESSAAGSSKTAASSQDFIPESARPSYVFLGVVAAVSLFADISTKVWAEIVLNKRGLEPINIIGDNFNITLAYNQGGAWGLLATTDKLVRLPFFLSVSVFAIFFIVSLYSRLHPSQKALKWGLPMVLGGALGNLSDRITRAQVIDFIDYRADWVMHANAFIAKYVKTWAITDHWPTFNVADIAICVGVGLMGVDMFTHRHRRSGSSGQDQSGRGGKGGGSKTDHAEQQHAVALQESAEVDRAAAPV